MVACLAVGYAPVAACDGDCVTAGRTGGEYQRSLAWASIPKNGELPFIGVRAQVEVAEDLRSIVDENPAVLHLLACPREGTAGLRDRCSCAEGLRIPGEDSTARGRVEFNFQFEKPGPWVLAVQMEQDGRVHQTEPVEVWISDPSPRDEDE